MKSRRSPRPTTTSRASVEESERAHAGRVGDVVLHRVSVVDRVPDRRGAAGRGGQAGAPGGRAAGRCAEQDAGGDGADDRAVAGCRRDRRGEPDGRVDWRTRFGIGAVEGDRRHGRCGFAPYARRNGGDFAGWCDCRRAAWLGRAQIVGHVVFGSGITMRPMVFVLVFVLLAVTVLVASLSSIRAILGLRPAEVLHGR